MKRTLLSILLLLAPAICFAQGQNFPGGSGGITSVSSLPQIAPNVAVIASPSCPTPSTNLNCVFVNDDGHFVSDATTTNASGVVTSPTANFQGTDSYGRPIAKNGQICEATSAVINGSRVIARGTLIVNSNTQITCSTTANSNLAGTAILGWGSDDTANLTAFSTAVGCNRGILPSGYMFTSTAQFGTYPAACLVNANTIFTSASITGQGFAQTWIVPTTDFNAATCTFGATADGCFFGQFTFEVDELTIWGLGDPRTASGTTHRILILGKATRGYNINATGWATSEALWNGISIQGGQDILQLAGAEGAGGNCAVDVNTGAAAAASLYANFMSGSNSGLCVLGASSVIEFDEVITGIGPASIVRATGSAGTFISSFATLFQGGSGQLFDCEMICQFHDSILQASAGKTAAFTNLAGARITAENTTFTGGSGAGTCITLVASTSFVDEGGNTCSGGSVPSIAATALVAGSLSAASSPAVIGNVVLTSGWGTSTVTSNSGDSHRMRFAISVTGVPGASPVITVTFPTAYPFIAPASCSITEVSGTFGIITNPSIGVPTTASVAITFSGTPVATNTYTFDLSCGY